MALGTLVILQVIASEIIAPSPPPQPPPPPVRPAVDLGPDWQFGLQFAGGGAQLAGHTWAEIGFGVGISRRVVGPLAVAVRGELLSTNYDVGDMAGTVILGDSLRGLAGLQLAVVDKKSGEMLRGRVVIGAGAGREVSGWDLGSVDRTFGYLEVEGRFGFAVPSSSPLKGISELGFVLGVRAQLSGTYAPEVIARACSHCGGMPEAPRDATDLAITGYYGLAFGR